MPDRPPLSVSVNLSSKSFAQSNLIENIDEMLRNSGLDESSLRLEITESVMMENVESTTVTLLQLRALDIL